MAPPPIHMPSVRLTPSPWSRPLFYPYLSRARVASPGCGWLPRARLSPESVTSQVSDRLLDGYPGELIKRSGRR